MSVTQTNHDETIHFKEKSYLIEDKSGSLENIFTPAPIPVNDVKSVHTLFDRAQVPELTLKILKKFPPNTTVKG